MKNSVLALGLLLSAAAGAQTTSATNGYEIRVTLKPFKNQYIYLGHYFGKQLPIIDSVKLNERSEGVFRGNKKLGGGIYLVGYPDKSRSFEILVDKNQKFAVMVDTLRPADLVFTNSPENDAFKAYQQNMNTWGRALDNLYNQRKGAAKEDSLRISREIDDLNAKVKTYRMDIITKQPNSLLAVLLKG